jgi:hypothetical protein
LHVRGVLLLGVPTGRGAPSLLWRSDVARKSLVIIAIDKFGEIARKQRNARGKLYAVQAKRSALSVPAISFV